MIFRKTLPPTVRKVHFLGVGGASLSSLARFLAEKGYEVSGTDRAYPPVLDSLRENGVRVWCGFEPVLTGRPDLVVYSSAVPSTDAELCYLRAAGVPCLERYAFLPYVTSFFRKTVAVAGTHGKTTVTGMCALCLDVAGKAYYAHIGGKSNDLGAYRYTGDDIFLTEACEYRKSFLSLRPDLGVVLNAEFDHPDTYGEKRDVYDAFDDFISSSDRFLVNGDCEYYSLRQAAFFPATFGFREGVRYRASDVKQYENGCFGCRIFENGAPKLSFRLRICGKHNLADAVAASAVCLSLGLPPEAIEKALEHFSGMDGRFTYKGRARGVPVYADYAHHPTAIRSAIETARLLTRGPVAVVFQPHTYSRTASLKAKFVDSLLGADDLIVVKEYAARETPSDGCSAESLFRAVPMKRKSYAPSLSDGAASLLRILSSYPADGIVLLLGAGDVSKIAELAVDSGI